MRNLFVKGLMATAAVVALASCSNDEEVAMPQAGETNDVALGVNVLIPGTKTAIDADDVNQNTEGKFAAIDGIYVVPMINGVRQTPISLEGILANAESKTTWKVAQISKAVNGFRVYGNMPADVIGSITAGDFSYAAPATEDNAHTQLESWMTDNMEGKSLVGQYPLLYFANSDAGDGYYAVKSDTDWDKVSGWGDATKVALGDKNRVKVSPVNYGVGVLASGVSYRRATRQLEKEAACFGNEESTIVENRKAYSDACSSTGMTLCGVFIQDQPTAIDVDLLGTDHNGVLVAAAAKQTLQTNALSFADGQNAVVTGANIYAIVTPEENEGIPVSFQFQNKTSKYLFLNTGDVVAPDGYAYYSTTLTKNGTSLKVFDADYTTLLNANIINWSNGTPYLPVTSDVQVGVEIDVQWQKGISYDVEI